MKTITVQGPSGVTTALTDALSDFDVSVKGRQPRGHQGVRYSIASEIGRVDCALAVWDINQSFGSIDVLKTASRLNKPTAGMRLKSIDSAIIVRVSRFVRENFSNEMFVYVDSNTDVQKCVSNLKNILIACLVKRSIIDEKVSVRNVDSVHGTTGNVADARGPEQKGRKSPRKTKQINRKS